MSLTKESMSFNLDYPKDKVIQSTLKVVEKMKGFNERIIRIFMKIVLSCKKSEICFDKKAEASKYKVCVGVSVCVFGHKNESSDFSTPLLCLSGN